MQSYPPIILVCWPGARSTSRSLPQPDVHVEKAETLKPLKS